MKIWVDTTDGTWGQVDGDQGRFLIVDLEQVADSDGEKTDAHSYLAALDSMSDSEVVDFADRYGRLAVPDPFTQLPEPEPAPGSVYFDLTTSDQMDGVYRIRDNADGLTLLVYNNISFRIFNVDYDLAPAVAVDWAGDLGFNFSRMEWQSDDGKTVVDLLDRFKASIQEAREGK